MEFNRRPRIIYNDDTISLRNIPGPHNPDQVRYAVDYLKDTQVDIVCWSMTDCCQAASFRSRAIENAYDGGDYDNNPRDLTRELYARGIDYLPLLINRTHENGLQFFASFRMNDVHHNSTPSIANKFWKDHQHYRLWEVTNGLTYYNACLDYSYPEVRDRMFNAMAEVADMYDIDGLEMDFCRNPFVFNPSEGWSKREILTDYIKKIRGMLHDIGKRKSKSISLTLRVPFKPEMLNNSGMDVESWINQGLMDILVMSDLANNYNRNVEPWLSLCRKKGIGFYPSVEVCPARHHEDDVRHAPDMGRHLGGADTFAWTDAHVKSTRAMAQNYWMQGVDGIYMFNYPCGLFERYNRLLENDPLFKPLVGVLSEIGSSETIRSTDKLYYFYTDLPVTVQSSRPAKYHQTVIFTIGDADLSDARVKLWFRQEAKKNPHIGMDYIYDPANRQWLKYYLNDSELSGDCIKITKQTAGSITGFKLDAHDLIEIDLQGDKLIQGTNKLAFEIPHFPKEKDPYIYIYEFEAEVFTKE